MIMSLKKKKNVIIITASAVVCFILYQLYFFLTITSEANNINVIPVFNHTRSTPRFHGVYHSQMPQYWPDAKNEFKCLNSEQRIPFQFVNDDYCDCEDGTDEPSTNACPKGVFYCDTQYHKKTVSLNTVPSSKVNDGICDCCDGSDEWLVRTNQKLLSQSNDKHYRFYVNNCQNICSE